MATWPSCHAMCWSWPPCQRWRRFLRAGDALPLYGFTGLLCKHGYCSALSSGPASPLCTMHLIWLLEEHTGQLAIHLDNEELLSEHSGNDRCA